MESTADNAATQQIVAALAAVDEERERLDVERDAFVQFRKRVAAMDVNEPVATTTTTAKVKNAVRGFTIGSTSSSSIEQVRDVYRETVMSVPHYEEDYNNSLATDLSEEFGPELAHALSTTDTLTPSLKEPLLTAATSAIEGRNAVLSALDRETDALQTASTTLEDLNTALADMNQQPLTCWSNQEWTAGYEQLREFEAQCDELAAERQADLHSQRVRGSYHIDKELNEYLYDSLPITYPILADIAEFTELLQTARQRLEREYLQ